MFNCIRYEKDQRRSPGRLIQIYADTFVKDESVCGKRCRYFPDCLMNAQKEARWRREAEKVARREALIKEYARSVKRARKIDLDEALSRCSAFDKEIKEQMKQVTLDSFPDIIPSDINGIFIVYFGNDNGVFRIGHTSQLVSYLGINLKDFLKTAGQAISVGCKKIDVELNDVLPTLCFLNNVGWQQAISAVTLFDPIYISENQLFRIIGKEICGLTRGELKKILRRNPVKEILFDDCDYVFYYKKEVDAVVSDYYPVKLEEEATK